MKFRTVILTALVVLVVAILGASLAVVATVLDTSARRDLAEELRRTREVFDDLQGYRQSLFASEARVIAEEPRVKAVVVAEEATPETVLGVAREINGALASDVLVFTNGTGRILASVHAPDTAGSDSSKIPAIGAALRDGTGSDVWIDGGDVYQMQARRVALGSVVYGVIAVGHRLDDRVATTVQKQTASAVVVELDGRPIAVSPFEGDAPSRDEIAALLPNVPAAGSGPVEITVQGTRYLAASAPFPGYAGPRPMRYVTFRSLDRALAPARRVTAILCAVLGVALVGALIMAFALSRRLSRPIDELVTLTQRFAAGELARRVAPSGPIELRALAESLNGMGAEIDVARRSLSTQERERKEMEIAQRIQTALLPKDVKVPQLEIASRMVPATDVGGDYYDILPVSGGCWIGIGDVAGHGVTAGLIMMMVQCTISTLVMHGPGGTPSEHVIEANRRLTENIRGRLGRDEHVTLTLLRYDVDGRIQFAGAHEDLLLCPANAGECRRIKTVGTWSGQRADISKVTKDSELKLEDGDVLALFTDGIIEARDDQRREFGVDRLCAELEAARGEPVETIRDRVFDAVARWTKAGPADDDMSLVILRYRSRQGVAVQPGRS